jgi:hypothetical protein
VIMDVGWEFVYARRTLTFQLCRAHGLAAKPPSGTEGLPTCEVGK